MESRSGDYMGPLNYLLKGYREWCLFQLSEDKSIARRSDIN